MALPRPSVKGTAAFCYVWLMLGFLTGTLVLLGPVRWLTNILRSRGYAQTTENLAIDCLIVVYVATSARLSYALGEEHEMPTALASTNKEGVPVVSILFAAVVGTLAFGPFKSWNALVAVVTAATAIMYAFAPLSLAALHRIDGRRPRSYRVPLPAVTLPAAFCCARHCESMAARTSCRAV